MKLKKQQLFKKKPSCKRRSFSLLEVVIGLSILAITGTIVAIKLNFASFKVDENIKKFNDICYFCRQMALTHQCDIFLDLEQDDKNGLKYTIKTDSIHGIFKTKALEKKCLENIFFTFNDESSSRLIISFYASGNISPLGKIVLFQKGHNPQATLDLKDVKKGF